MLLFSIPFSILPALPLPALTGNDGRVFQDEPSSRPAVQATEPARQQTTEPAAQQATEAERVLRMRHMLRWARAGDEEKTLRLLEDVLAAGPPDAAFALDLARRLRDTPVSRALVRAAEETLRRGASPHEGNRLLAEGAARSRDFDAARHALTLAIQARPDCEECHDRLATLCAAYRRYEAAVTAQRWLVARNPEDALRRLRLARYLVELQRYDEAYRIAGEAGGLARKGSREAAEGRVLEAKALEAQGNASGGLAALAPLQDFHTLPPDLAAEAHFVRGLLLERTAALEQAGASFRAALANRAAPANPDLEALAHYHLGRVLLRLGHRKEGRRQLELYAQTRKREAFTAKMGLPGADD